MINKKKIKRLAVFLLDSDLICHTNTYSLNIIQLFELKSMFVLNL